MVLKTEIPSRREGGDGSPNINIWGISHWNLVARVWSRVNLYSSVQAY